jgi:hypothetical protein
VNSPPPHIAPVIVTAASDAYAGCLARLLRNLARRGLARTHRVIAYDLGLSAARRADLARRFPWCEFRPFDFAAHPPHVAPAARTYAWKPILLGYLLDEISAPLLWLDSASQVRTDLGAVRAALARHGLCVLRGQSPLRVRCDPAVARALGVAPPLLDAREFVAGACAFDPALPAVRALVAEWRRCALDPALMLPRHARHNPEQAILSILVLAAAAAGRLAFPPGDIDISSPTPVRWLRSRQKVPRDWPAWADPLASLWFGADAAVNQCALRVAQFKATRINGLHRWPKENFVVAIGRVGGGARTLAAPRGTYFADPFLWRRDGRAWVFAEQFSFLENTARLVALPLDDALHAGAPEPLELHGAADCHRSFPFLCELGGELFLVPESSAQRAVDLFVCEEFPLRWRWRRRLLDGVDAADSALLRHADRWWLFTSVRPHEHAPRALEIHHTDDLLAGRWEPHPVNAERRYADAPCSSGRCAGAFVRAADGAWLRAVQASRRFYGEGARLMCVVTLTPEAFHEEEFSGAHPLAELAAKFSPHHLSQHDGLVACDVRTRASYGQHVPLWRHWARRPDPRALTLASAR